MKKEVDVKCHVGWAVLGNHLILMQCSWPSEEMICVILYDREMVQFEND